MNDVLILSALILSAVFAGSVFSRLHIPRLIAYLFVGIVFSQLFKIELDHSLAELALGFIAFLVGGSLHLESIKQQRKVIFATALGGVLGVIVAMVLILPLFASEWMGVSIFIVALLLGGLGTSTDPAAIESVTQELGSHGDFVTVLKGVVAIDDAMGVMAFALILSWVGASTLGWMPFVGAMYEIAGGVLLGLVMAKFLVWAGSLFRQVTLVMPFVFAMILFVFGLSQWLELSMLLALMSLGFFAHLFARHHAFQGRHLFAPIRHFEEMILIVFFSLAGVAFVPEVLLEYGHWVLLYVMIRMLGKVGGVAFFARWAGADAVTQKWLGIALLPQAGVAIGMALVLKDIPGLSDVAEILLGILVAGAVVNELLGPILLKWVLTQKADKGVK